MHVPIHRNRKSLRSAGLLWILLAGPVWSQAPAPSGAAEPRPSGGGISTEMSQILERLDRLERENQSLRQEVRELRDEVAGLRPQPRTEEKLAIQDERIREHEQVKVGTSQRFPLRITGMALFNLFGNGSLSGGRQNPLLASPQPGDREWGGTLRQSVLGLQYDGPTTVWGGKVHGNLSMDFFAGSGQSLGNTLRIRTGSIEVDWKSRSILVGQEKPLMAPRDPTSYAQVGVSPLSDAGNLWLWLPQVRFEQRLDFGRDSGLRAQLGFIQTSESYSPPGRAGFTEEQRRPGLEGRFELWHRFDDSRRIEFAPGFHVSTSHVLGSSLPSNLVSLDWFANPWARIEFSGALFSGQNIGYFGAPHAGFTFLADGRVIPVHSRGGWAQLTFPVTSRLSFNLLGGDHDDRNADLLGGDAGNNRASGANVIYRLAPNVILSFEAMQVRTTYLSVGRRINNHYDLALAYLF